MELTKCQTLRDEEMKEIALIITLLICQTTSGQQISLSNNRYRGNDVLEKKQIEAKGFSLNDTKGVWSLEEAELSEESYDTVSQSVRHFVSRRL